MILAWLGSFSKPVPLSSTTGGPCFEISQVEFSKVEVCITFFLRGPPDDRTPLKLEPQAPLVSCVALVELAIVFRVEVE